VDDADLNTNSGAVETLLVDVNSTSENATSRADGTSSDTEGGTQDVTVSPGLPVYDRTQDGSITAADFTLLGASDEVISSVSPNSLGAGSYTVTVSDSGGSVDGNPETVSYTKLTYQSLSSDTDTSQQVTTNSPVGDRNRDGVIDKTDIAFVSSAPSESITNFNRNADGTATFDIVDSSDSDDVAESFTYLSAETVALAETGADTGIFTGSISLVQSDANGDLLAVEGDDINLTYYDQSPSATRVATQTLDATSPSISSVSLSEDFGDQRISFESDEQLGGSSGDLAVTVSGPNGATYSYARGDFSQSSIGGGSYAYVLKSGSAQPYDNGDGTYGMSISDAKDAAGNNGGNNGDGSGLTDTYSYSSGGGDTTPPSISGVTLDESSGNMVITFNSDEQLGTSASDITVAVTGPNGATYTFDLKQFAESGSGPYIYSLSTTQAYDDGGGSYTMSVDDAKDSAGNNGGNNGAGSGLTDTHVYSSSSGTDTWVNGTVTDASGSVSGATVVAVPQSGGSETVVTTGANGDYSLGVQPSTTYDVIVDDEPDHKFEVETGISVSKSNTRTVDFTVKAFPEKGFINGTVLDADENAVSKGYSVEARELGYRFGGTATTDANGKFSVSVPASNYVVRAKGSNGPPKKLDNVTVREGETTDVTVRLPEAGYITGTVESAAGKKVGGVGVVADDGDQVVFDRTNTKQQADTGTYNITASPGNYTVSVFTKGKSTNSKQVTVTGGSESTADFTLRTTSVKHASVKVIEGSGVDTANLGISASVRAGMLQVKVNNQSSGGGGGSGGAPDELEGLGVTRDTKLRMNVTVTNFTANSLMWGVGDARWSTADNASITNGTDITVTGTPVQLQVMFGGKGGGSGDRCRPPDVQGPLGGELANRAKGPGERRPQRDRLLRSIRPRKRARVGQEQPEGHECHDQRTAILDAQRSEPVPARVGRRAHEDGRR
jgi:hypothetical protein